MSIKLYNKGKRTIFGDHDDMLDEATGKFKPFSFGPGSTGEFSDSVGNNLRRLYPNEIVSLEDVKREQFEGKKEAATVPVITVEESNKQVAIAVAAAIKAEREKIFVDGDTENKAAIAQAKILDNHPASEEPLPNHAIPPIEVPEGVNLGADLAKTTTTGTSGKTIKQINHT